MSRSALPKRRYSHGYYDTQTGRLLQRISPSHRRSLRTTSGLQSKACDCLLDVGRWAPTWPLDRPRAANRLRIFYARREALDALNEFHRPPANVPSRPLSRPETRTCASHHQAPRACVQDLQTPPPYSQAHAMLLTKPCWTHSLSWPLHSRPQPGAGKCIAALVRKQARTTVVLPRSASIWHNAPCVREL